MTEYFNYKGSCLIDSVEWWFGWWMLWKSEHRVNTFQKTRLKQSKGLWKMQWVLSVSQDWGTSQHWAAEIQKWLILDISFSSVPDLILGSEISLRWQTLLTSLKSLTKASKIDIIQEMSSFSRNLLRIPKKPRQRRKLVAMQWIKNDRSCNVRRYSWW